MKQILERGTVEIIDRADWEKKWDKPMRVKFGIDPTAAKVHLGHAVVLRKLRQFQQAGHSIHLIIGTGTACVGDPSGRDKARQGIDIDQAEENAKGYLKQIGKFLDLKITDVHFNHTWFDRFGHREWMALLSHVTAQQLLQRADFAKRIEDGTPLAMTELMYPMMQAWDSYCIGAELEIGGTEQLFNLQLGRHIQKEYGRPQQIVMTMPLLRGLDGVQKMGKSLNNYIAVDEEPFEMFSKVMSISDEMMPEWYKLLTERDPVFLSESMFTLKKQLAYDIVEMLHGMPAALDSIGRWSKQFSERADPEDMPEVKIDVKKTGNTMKVVDLLVEIGFATSKSEARRLITPGNCVSIGPDRTEGRVTDAKAEVPLWDGMVVRAGNRRICRVRAETWRNFGCQDCGKLLDECECGK